MPGRLLLNALVESTVPLPGRLAAPLHFPTPPSCAWLVLWLLLVAGLVSLLMRLLWRRWRARSRPAPQPPRPASSPPPPAGDIVAAIAALRRRTLESRRYRHGCHELSQTLRSHWEAHPPVGGQSGPRLTRMTAAEITGRLGQRPVSRFLSLLSQLQFGRQAPSQGDFVGACELAGELTAKRGAR